MLTDKLIGNKPLRKLKHRWEQNIKIGFEEVASYVLKWLIEMVGGS